MKRKKKTSFLSTPLPLLQYNPEYSLRKPTCPFHIVNGGPEMDHSVARF